MSNASHTTLKSEETMNAQHTSSTEYNLDICTSDPAWAEHARPNDDGPDPCDDGRGIQFETDSN